MKCPACGARNPEGAGWCGQCYERFTPPAAEAATPPAAEAATPPAGGDEAADRDVRERDGEVEWRCHRCDAWNALTLAACGTCGAAREGFATPDRQAATRSVTPATAIGASAVLPGLGHLLAGRAGSGLARMLLAVLWGGGALALLRAEGPTRMAGASLAVGWAVLWAGTLVDASRLPGGRGPELLGTRALGILVAVVTLLLVLGVVAAGLAAVN